MKETYSKSWKIMYNFTDGCFLDVFWECPYHHCGFLNHDIVSTSKSSIINESNFLIEHECCYCLKKSSIICDAFNKVD